MPDTFDKVLITGGGGMLATALRKQLRARNIDPLMLKREQLDIGDIAAVGARVKSHQSSLILNCAAFTKVDLCEDPNSPAEFVNGRDVFNVAISALESGATLVHFSTDFVFDGRASQPYKPSDKPNPLSAYGKSKRIGEREIEQLGEKSGLKWMIIRTSWLYGSGGPNFVQTMLNHARAGKSLSVVDDQIGSPTYTHDLADATLDLIDRNARGVFHVTNAGQTSWFEFAKAIFEEFGLSPKLSASTSAAWKTAHPASAIRPAYSVLDCSETERVIKRKLPDWRDALRRYRREIEVRA